jgi:hypothetical protein
VFSGFSPQSGDRCGGGKLSMTRLGLGLIIAWLCAGQALGAESAADAMRAFGLIGG